VSPFDSETHESGPDWLDEPAARETLRWCLVVLWAEDPARMGEVAFVRGPTIVGRGPARDDDPHPRASWVEQRPGRIDHRGPLASRRLSRVQLCATPGRTSLGVENLGRADMRCNGIGGTKVEARPGDVLMFEDALVLQVDRRPAALPEAPCAFPFGTPDPDGLVGESVAAWALRERLVFVGVRSEPALLTGETGSGKEVAARALHRASAVGTRPWVSRSAATLPEGLIDAELFGTTRNYPNAGMPDRPGLVGQADGTTLFLDEIGELPTATQAHLLRVLDSGEYTRLGEARPRTSRFRMLAATNRDVSTLKHDLAARFTLRVEVPGLTRRVADIPLLTRHIVKAVAHDDPLLADRFLDDAGEPRVAPSLVEALALHRWTSHVRELHRLLLQSLETSTGRFLDLTPQVAGGLTSRVKVDPADLSAAQVKEALAAVGGNRSQAWKRLGLQSRDQLYRLLKRHGID